MAVVVTMLALGLSGLGEGIEDCIGGLGWAVPARCRAAMRRRPSSGREQTVTEAPASVSCGMIGT